MFGQSIEVDSRPSQKSHISAVSINEEAPEIDYRDETESNNSTKGFTGTGGELAHD